MMKFAVQLNMLPGGTVSEQFALAKKIGFDGIEVQGSGLGDVVDEVQKASDEQSLPVSSICAGYRGTPLAADPAERQIALDDIEKLLGFGGKLGCVGLIMVPIFYGPQIPDLSPWKSFRELETELFVAQLKQLGPVAQQNNTLILIESLNRYETHFLNT
ncbi:MAG: TIM barrel protein, partial [Phycisphaerae bacterium]|nr:TIM barrel protein [Phycisphaerae bacterium]